MVASMMVTECVLNAESYSNKLETARKTNTYICKECGLSKADLPAALQNKFDEFSSMDEKTDAKTQPNLAVPKFIMFGIGWKFFFANDMTT